MQSYRITKGATSQTIQISVFDSSSTTGAKLTGLAFNTAGLTAYYSRPRATPTSITLATQTVTGAYSSGGFVAVDGTNMPGVYRFDIPDAAIATGVDHVWLHFKGATNMVPVDLRVDLTSVDLQDATRGGMTALPNANAAASGGLIINGSNSGTVTLAALTVSGASTFTGNVAMQAGLTVTQSTTNGAGVSITGNGTGHGLSITSGSGATGNGLNVTSSATNGNAINALGSGTGDGFATKGGVTGTGLHASGGSTSGGGILADVTSGAPITGALTGNITGNLSGSVGSVTGAVGSVTGAVGSVTGNVGGNVVGSTASVTGAVGSVTGNVGGNVVGSVASVTNPVTVGTVNASASNIKKNTALSAFSFLMTDSTTHQPKTGVTVTATRSLDGAAFAACANAVTELANGIYLINLAASDLNANVITLRFTGTAADDRDITIITQP